MARVFHWKHGWIPLDHAAAPTRRRNTPSPVSQDHLPRSRHIVAAHARGKFVLHDKKTGNTASLSEAHALALKGAGHRITTVHSDGAVSTRGNDAAARTAAARTVAAAKAAEPELTKLVQGIADKHGGRLEGLAYRVKTEESLARKLSAEVAESKVPPPVTATLAAAKMFDVNRYTSVHKEATYARDVQASLDALRADGYTLKVKNYWNVKENPYKGVNVQVTSPSGRKFELQFHTDTSLAVKEGDLHTIYEKQRVEPDPAKRAAYAEQMHTAAAKIPDPRGIGDVR